MQIKVGSFPAGLDETFKHETLKGAMIVFHLFHNSKC